MSNDLDRTRRIVQLLMEKKMVKQIIHLTGASHDHIHNVKFRYLRETVTLRLNAEGKKLMNRNQLNFEFIVRRKHSVTSKILRSLGKK